MNRLEKIGELAIRWGNARAEHKQRKKESKQAAVVALRCGATLDYVDGYAAAIWNAETPEQRRAAERAEAAYARYQDATKSFVGAQAALTRVIGANAMPDEDIAAAFSALIDTDRDKKDAA